MLRSVIAALVLATSTAAAAHSFWLEPDDFTPEFGEDVRVDFKVGHPGDVADWGLYWERIASIRILGPHVVQDKQHAVRTTDVGEPGGMVLNLRERGTHVLAFESNPSFSDLPADRFNDYIEKHGLTAIIEHRRATGATEENGTELYARRAKTLLKVGEGRSYNFKYPMGQTLEIVPLEDPFRMRDDELLPLQVLWRGEPLAEAKVFVSDLDATEEGPSLTTQLDGTVYVPKPGADGVLYSVVWGVPAPNDSRADYFTIFASLTIGGVGSDAGVNAGANAVDSE